MIPQLLLTLSPTGALIAELPGQPLRVCIPIDDAQAANQLRHLLKDQLLPAASEAHIATQMCSRHTTYDTEIERLIDTTHKARIARTRHTQPAQLAEQTTKSRPPSPRLPINFDDLGI